MKHRDDVEAIAKKLEEWRREAEVSIPDVHADLVEQLGKAEVPSVETIRQLHKGVIATPQRTHLAMLARYYGHEVAELHEGTAKVLAFIGSGVQNRKKLNDGQKGRAAAKGRHPASGTRARASVAA